MLTLALLGILVLFLKESGRKTTSQQVYRIGVASL